MRITRTYIKQSENGVASHVYEHVVATHVLKELSNHGYQQLIDYEFAANSYDGIIVLRFDTYSKRVFTVFDAALRSIDISTRAVQIAVTQIACEYERMDRLEMAPLIQILQSIHASKWVLDRQYTHSKAIMHADARELMTSIGGFGALQKKNFHHVEVSYTIESCPYELKSLAVYVTQIIALNLINQLVSSVESCYDAGDQWAEYQDLVGYAHTITTPKDVVLTQALMDKTIRDTLEVMTSPKNLQKMVRYVKRDTREMFPYFSLESMFAKAYQVTGYRGFAQTASTEVIEQLIQSLEIRFEHID